MQHVDQPTRVNEILDLIWSSNPDLISNVAAESYREFSDHSVVSASTTFQLKDQAVSEPSYLLDCGRRFSLLNFHKAPWTELKSKLSAVDWSELETERDCSKEVHWKKIWQKQPQQKTQMFVEKTTKCKEASS